LMRASVDTGRSRPHRVYRRSGQPCPRCRTPIRSWGQGDDNRMAYWCPRCQAGDDPRRS
jgi:endonuclease-8